MRFLIIGRCASAALALALNSSLAAASSAVWKGGTGTWETAGNWSPAIVPNGSTTNVSIDASTSVVTESSNSAYETVDSLGLTDGAQLSLTKAGGISLVGGLNLSGGATLNLSSGNLSLVQSSPSISIGGSGSIYFSNGTNSIGFASTSGAAGTQLTIGRNVLIHGVYGFIGGGSLYTNTSVINQGTIDSDGGSDLYVTGDWTNQGTMEATEGGLFLEGTGNNSGGTYAVSTGGTLYIAYNGTLAQLGTIVQSGGTVDLTGTIDGQGGSLDFGSGVLEGVNIAGGINNAQINFSGGGQLSTGGVALTNDQLNCSMSVSSLLSISNGLTLNNSVLTIGGTVDIPGVIGATQTIGGAGKIIFNPSATYCLVQYSPGGPSPLITIGSGVTLRGGQTTFAINLANQGVINPDTAGKTLSFQVFQIANSGLVEATAGTIDISPTGSMTNTGTVAALTGGTFEVDGGLSNTGTLLVDSSSRMVFGNGLTLGNGSVLDLQLTSIPEAALLQITGNLNLSAGNLSLEVSPSSLPLATDLVATYTGTLSGSFNNIPPDISIDYAHPGEIFVTVVPEPGGLIVAALASTAVMLGRRDKYRMRQRRWNAEEVSTAAFLSGRILYRIRDCDC